MHGLYAIRRQVDDGKPPMSQADMVVKKFSVGIRSTVRDDFSHPVEQRGVSFGYSATGKSCYAAHEIIPVSVFMLPIDCPTRRGSIQREKQQTLRAGNTAGQ